MAFLLLLLLFGVCSVLATPTKRASWKYLQTTQHGGVAFGLGNQTYFANVRHPKAIVDGDYSAIADQSSALLPFTVIFTGDEIVTGEYLQNVVASYLAGDDVFSEDFLEGVYIASNETSNGTSSSPTLDASALEYLNSLAPKHLLLDAVFEQSHPSSEITATYVTTPSSNLTAGPYVASISASSITFNTVYLLYRDSHRDFLYGTYDSNDGNGTFNPVEISYSRFWDPMIPVPSRIYSWSDPRPLAGSRVAIKDLFDMKGLITSGGSQAWAEIVEPVNETAPSVQRIVDLGGVLVGKYKLAQFASGADPWEWQDEHYPFNPRGDGWLTCSASSSGGGCSVAAYDWLDFAIGSDTGSSMRRPAAVSGTYGNRPSQGLMSLTGVMPLGAATDTAGVFSRNVHDWVHFAKNWYIPELCQDSSVTGLSPLKAPDSYGFPKRVLYLTDYLPLRNPAAEEVLQAFIQNMTSVFGMTVENFNLTAAVYNTTDDVPKYGALENITGVLDTMTQWQVVGQPLITTWAERYEGRFPPIDAARRDIWTNYSESYFTDELYNQSIAFKRAAVDWFESEILYSTEESCSESIMLWDIGTGGLPSYREESLNGWPGTTSFLATTPPTAGINGAYLCPFYGCVDMTIPIGQVPYSSNVTFVEEMVPVTISVIAKRGCDFMLWNMWEKLADEGVLKTIKTGRTAF
ncbi:amidase family protein [Hypoxylon trugodes]|uniref:amidase family protein n=1 Tax=Hypoxylon trugodes TaxID=326681 RepID=UPI00219FD042|nr:amidase family protein [Hypoxylon trugodes]KAI1389131.1 amidase family protein [Hypoxylon trugodes]